MDGKKGKISIIIPCKNRLKHLKRIIYKVINQTIKCEIVIVDMGCPQKTYNWVATHLKGQVVNTRMDVSDNYWNLSESRNFGYRNSTGDILVFIDADTVLNYYFLEYTKLGENEFITGTMSPPYNCCGCLMVSRKDFENVKGYNEELKGWGYEDFDIRERLEKTGLMRREFKRELIRSLDHANYLRNQFNDFKTLDQTNNENRQIAKIKFKGL